jgi:class 3 adenylate cyclase
LKASACGAKSLDGCGFCGRGAASLSLSAAEWRNVVTTLVCDLVAFTTVSKAAHPEDVDTNEAVPNDVPRSYLRGVDH